MEGNAVRGALCLQSGPALGRAACDDRVCTMYTFLAANGTEFNSLGVVWLGVVCVAVELYRRWVVVWNWSWTDAG